MSINEGTVCDDRVIRCDMDGGFREGRQFGRGESTLISSNFDFIQTRRPESIFRQILIVVDLSVH